MDLNKLYLFLQKFEWYQGGYLDHLFCNNNQIFKKKSLSYNHNRQNHLIRLNTYKYEQYYYQ